MSRTLSNDGIAPTIKEIVDHFCLTMAALDGECWQGIITMTEQSDAQMVNERFWSGAEQ